MKSKEYTVTESGRLDATLRAFETLSHKKSRDAIRTGKIFVDGTRQVDPGFRVKPGQCIELKWAAPNAKKEDPNASRLIYRDAHILVINKPAGLVSTPNAHTPTDTALHLARRFCRGGKAPLVVHRLDKDTSGLMVFARGEKAARRLRQAMDVHDVERVYYCVVEGRLPHEKGTIVSALLRNAGKGRRGSVQSTFQILEASAPLPTPKDRWGQWSITRYRTVETTGTRSALEVTLETGRTHQIRIHMAEARCPILGERVYAKQPDAPRQALHAGRLSFQHPLNQEPLSFSAPWASDLINVTPIGCNW